MINKDKETIFNDLHPHMSRALQAAGLHPQSVLVELARILFPTTEVKEGDDTVVKVKNSDKLRAMEIWSKMVGAYAPETKTLNVNGISIGVKEPEDIDI